MLRGNGAQLFRVGSCFRKPHFFVPNGSCMPLPKPCLSSNRTKKTHTKEKRVRTELSPKPLTSASSPNRHPRLCASSAQIAHPTLASSGRHETNSTCFKGALNCVGMCFSSSRYGQYHLACTRFSATVAISVTARSPTVFCTACVEAKRSKMALQRKLPCAAHASSTCESHTLHRNPYTPRRHQHHHQHRQRRHQKHHISTWVQSAKWLGRKVGYVTPGARCFGFCVKYILAAKLEDSASGFEIQFLCPSVETDTKTNV